MVASLRREKWRGYTLPADRHLNLPKPWYKAGHKYFEKSFAGGGANAHRPLCIFVDGMIKFRHAQLQNWENIFGNGAVLRDERRPIQAAGL